MKLNLGCGKDNRKGYVNIDAQPGTGVDKVFDITKKLPFKDESCSEIIMQDILEHLIPKDQEKVLNEVNRVLNKIGKLVIRTPNIEAIWEKMDNPEVRNLFLYGETEEQGIWGAHKTGHTLISIGTLFRMCNFKINQWKEIDTNWEFELVKEKTQGHGKVWQINKPVKKWYWWYRILGLIGEEFAVPNQEVFNSLFPKTHIPITRVKINQLEYQQRRAYARQKAKMDLGL
jgi:hypothetical protein